MNIYSEHVPLNNEESDQEKPKREAIIDIIKIAGP